VKISIIIPTYNRSDLLSSAVASVQALVVPSEWQVEIVIIDNNSTDRTADVAQAAQEMGPLPVRYITETKQGLNHSRNRGLLESAADWIVYLDDDMVVSPAWLLGLADSIEQERPDVVVGPIQPWFEEAPEGWLSAAAVEPAVSNYSQKGDILKALDIDSSHRLPGCNFAIVRTVGIKAGGFNPFLDRAGKRMLAGGDFEFGARITRLGGRVVYSPKCSIRHLISGAKISPKGLRARWRGLGATERAMHYLQDKPVSRPALVHLVVGMLKAKVRSYLYRLSGRRSQAFDEELMFLKVWGYLFDAPRLEPLTWPPRPLVPHV
jgi:glycosyltransferase involved in cell wall biosynthesis